MEDQMDLHRCHGGLHASAPQCPAQCLAHGRHTGNRLILSFIRSLSDSLGGQRDTENASQATSCLCSGHLMGKVSRVLRVPRPLTSCPTSLAIICPGRP